MELIRKRLERQVMGLTGLVLGEIDYEQPGGDPGLFGPGSACWRVHGDFPSMLCGGIGALMLQMLHPLALAGVWDHSTFRDDMIGRLRRTSQFIAGTTFASKADAERLIARVRRIHDGVTGHAPDGRPYAASDPDLLVWIHVAEVRSFMAAYLRYGNPLLSATDQDRYYDEVARVAEALGAREVPRSRQAIDDYLDSMRPQLVFDERTAEVLTLLLHAPAPSLLTGLAGRWMTQAGLDLMPEWALAMTGQVRTPARRKVTERGMHGLAPIMRWALRNSARHRAERRVGVASPVS